MSDELKEVEKERAKINKNLGEKQSAIVQVARSRMAAAKTKKQKGSYKKESDEEE